MTKRAGQRSKADVSRRLDTEDEVVSDFQIRFNTIDHHLFCEERKPRQSTFAIPSLSKKVSKRQPERLEEYESKKAQLIDPTTPPPNFKGKVQNRTRKTRRKHASSRPRPHVQRRQEWRSRLAESAGREEIGGDFE